jgi:hypothetical protein
MEHQSTALFVGKYCSSFIYNELVENGMVSYGGNPAVTYKTQQSCPTAAIFCILFIVIVI